MQIQYFGEDVHGEQPEAHEIADGISLDLPAQVRFDGVDIDGVPHVVEMVLRMTPDGVRPTAVSVVSADRSTAITGTTLRSVKVWELASKAIRLGLNRAGGQATMLGAERAGHLRALGPQPETLEWVAYFYKLGGVLGLPPAREVEINLGVPRTTASKWVRRAREAGFING